MKLLTVIFATILCIGITYGAPSTQQHQSFDEVISLDLFENFDIIENVLAHVKCVQRVFDDIMDESDLKTIWLSTKTELKTIFDKKLPECSRIPDKFYQEKCRIDCIRNGTQVIHNFFTELVDENQSELAKRLRSEVIKQCFTGNDINEEMMFSLQEPFAGPSMTDGFQCLVDTLQQVSQDLNLDALWESNALEIQKHLDNWKECANLDNRFAIIFCSVKESVVTYKLIIEYMRQAVTENQEFVKYFLSEYRQNCAVSVPQMIGIESSIEHLKCMIDAIGAAVQETDFGLIWDGYKSDLDKVLQRIKLCQDQTNKWEAAKCVSKEIYGSYDVFKNFMSELKKANQDTYIRVKNYIKQRCY